MFWLLRSVVSDGSKGVGSEASELNKISRSSLCLGHTVRIWSMVSSVSHDGQRGEIRGFMRCLETLESF